MSGKAGVRRARTAFRWKDVSTERPRKPARAGVALIEGGVVYFVRADHTGKPGFSSNTSGTKARTATRPSAASTQAAISFGTTKSTVTPWPKLTSAQLSTAKSTTSVAPVG